MVRSKVWVVTSAMLLAGMLLSACGGASQPPVTVVVQGTPQVVEVTSTPVPELPAGSVQINGAGATFPLPVYTEWTYAYQYVDPSVAINYQGIGSGGGKKGIVDGTIDFAGSDSLLKDEEYAAGKDLQMYPMLAGAVAPIYNIKWAKEAPSGTTLPGLVLDRATLVGIYNAAIKKWNDPAIVATNPDLKDYLPAASITVAHRSDGSGTTEIFTKSLASFSADWKAGGAASVEWPVDKAGNGVGGKGNAGVAAVVINTPNSIGYVELSYAVANKIPYVAMVNKAGQTVKADAASLASAMADFSGGFDAKLTATIVDAPGAGSWPIAGYTYIILHTTSMSDCVKAEKLLGFLNWALGDAAAAKRAADLGYAVLPDAVKSQVLARLAEVTCGGQPVMMSK
jgi:phosphate transport system substrate-binding protein